jgi:hypothetical protein
MFTKGCNTKSGFLLKGGHLEGDEKETLRAQVSAYPLLLCALFVCPEVPNNLTTGGKVKWQIEQQL